MWPSTSWGTCRGSQFGIWLATAVIRPKLKDASPTSRRMSRRTARRSLRIRRLRPFGAGAGLLRLRRNKRRILALGGVLDGQEWLARGSIRTAVPLDREHYGGLLRDAPGEQHHADVAATVERAGRLGAPAAGDPGLIRPAGACRSETVHDEHGIAGGRDDERPAVVRERIAPGARVAQNGRDPLLVVQRLRPAIELVRQGRRPDAQHDGCDGGDCRGRCDGNDPARPERYDVGALAASLLQDARA